MTEEKIYNALISDTYLGIESHGLLYLNIDFRFEGSAQGTATVVSTEVMGEYIEHILNAVGVKSWEELTGKYVRIVKDDVYGSCIKKIGHIIEDEWFDFGEFIEKKIEEYRRKG